MSTIVTLHAVTSFARKIFEITNFNAFVLTTNTKEVPDTRPCINVGHCARVTGCSRTGTRCGRLEFYFSWTQKEHLRLREHKRCSCSHTVTFFMYTVVRLSGLNVLSTPINILYQTRYLLFNPLQLCTEHTPLVPSVGLWGVMQFKLHVYLSESIGPIMVPTCLVRRENSLLVGHGSSPWQCDFKQTLRNHQEDSIQKEINSGNSIYRYVAVIRW